MLSEELLLLASCLLRPMSRNSVLEEIGVRRFADSHEEIRFLKVIYAGVEVSRKEGKKAVSSV